MKNKLLTLSFVVALSLIGALSLSSNAEASGFNAGRIIEDGVFTNYRSMSAGQIQSFLNSKVSNCDTWGEKPSEYGGGTRRQYAESKGVSPPFTCLKDYNQHGKSAAQIIYDAAQEFRINPQVLIVLLQKEQGLITDEWPWPIQYRSATGYGCPDTAPCDSDYYGLTNQVRWAARMFRAIMDNSPTWYTPYVLGNNQIPWNPDTGRCGYSTVNIQNRATQALYNYTPYRPNQAALNAGYGTGDSCSSYGNRNFYLYFRDWFGFTYDISKSFIPLENPRWMRTKQPTQKVNILTTQKMSDNNLSTHQQIKFVDKVHVNGAWHLRTEFDRKYGNLLGIPQNELEEIPYENLANPMWKTLTKDGNKSFPSSRRYAEPLPKGTSIKFTQRIRIDDVTYYRTEHDATHGNEQGVISRQLSDFQFIPLDVPTYMHTNSEANKVDVLTQNVHNTIPKGSSLKLERKTRINGVWYFQELADHENGNNLAINSLNISRNEKTALEREMTITMPKPTYKHNLHNLAHVTANPLSTNQKIVVSHSIMVDGDLYYVTKFDMEHDNHQGIKVSDLFIDLDIPRVYSAINDTNKRRLSDFSLGDNIAKDQEIFYSTKISINGRWCLRSKFDTGIDNLLCVPIESLR